TIDIRVQGTLRNCLALVCLDHSQREKFSLVCDDFLDPAKRVLISNDPAEWWEEWSELMGNSNSDQSPHAVLGELLVWQSMYKIKQRMNWSGPDASSHDLVGIDFDIEVKSTIKRYGKRVTVSGEHQLSVANGKRLFLIFMRFEATAGGNSINSVIANLMHYGANGTTIQNNLAKMRYQTGKSTRAKTYMVHDAEVYEVSNTFPRITPAAFAGGVTPMGIEQIKYEIDLSLIKPYSTLDQFSP
ncbi:MAG: PD-(D/E)XK motif protein, partial [Chthoniobacteraceae bacterium]|nr:PD-(D/E)XK motif protein [Chthoniobacteraceae bacterium]